MSGQLEGRVALITGGTAGIGEGIAKALAAEGAKVAITARSPEKGAAAVERISAVGDVRFHACDVLDQAQVEEQVAWTVSELGRLDILVNNAGGTDGFAPVHELSDEAWNKALNWNLNSTFWATRAALRAMLPNQWGRIINISSVEGKVGNKHSLSHYVTNKHAINGFTKAVAAEYGALGITSNAICPGAIETDTMKTAGASAAESAGITYEQFLDVFAQESMIKRLNTADEVAAMALLLASDLGGGITGALISVDGGTSPW